MNTFGKAKHACFSEGGGIFPYLSGTNNFKKRNWFSNKNTLVN